MDKCYSTQKFSGKGLLTSCSIFTFYRILEDMTTQTAIIDAPRRKFSVEEYHRLIETGILTQKDRVELVFGEIIERSPIGPKHAGNLDRIDKFLTLLVMDDGIVRVQSPIQLGTHSEPEPDISLLKPRDDFYTTSHPCEYDVLLILELSDSSLKYDKETKLPLYASFHIPEVWLIDLNNERVTVYRDSDGEQFLQVKTYRKGEMIDSNVLTKPVAVEKVLI